MNPQPRFTVRLRFTKRGKIRFTSHRDVARIMERALRKLRLPLSYSEGFSPRPRIAFGLALSVAHESDAEYLDIDLVTPVDLEDLPSRLCAALPDGLTVVAAGHIEPGSASLQEAISSCRWLIEVLDASMTDVTAAVSALLDAAELPLERQRKGKTTVVDVRPCVLTLEVLGPIDDGVQLAALLSTEPVSLRPSEFISALSSMMPAPGPTESDSLMQSPTLREGRVRRTHQFITTSDGDRFEPLGAPDTSQATDSPPAPTASAAMVGAGSGP